MALILLLSLFLLSPAGHAVDIILPAGGTHHIATSPHQTVHISNSRVVKLVDQQHRLLVIAKKPGNARVNIGSRSYSVTVVSLTTFKAHERLKGITDTLLGLSTAIEDDVLSIQGTLHRFSDWHKIANASELKNINFLMKAAIDKDLFPQIQAHFQNMMSEQQLPHLELKLHPRAEVLIAPSLHDFKAPLEKLLSPYGIPVLTSPTLLGLKPLIRVKITVAEVKKHYHRRLGIEWPTTYQAKLFAPAVNSSLELALHAMEQQGWGQILASPTLLAQSGSEAQFLAGGEFPIKVGSYRNPGVTWKKHGVLLSIKPEADFQGRMRIQLTSEISVIDSAQSVDGVPGLKTNRLSSHFNIRGSQTIVLSGLIKSSAGSTEQGLTGLRSLPVLGRLFSSSDFQKEKSELIVFVTPEIISPDLEPRDKPNLPKSFRNDSELN